MERETITKENYLKNLDRRSFNSARSHKTVINSFEIFAKNYPVDLKTPLNTVSSFLNYLESQNKSPETINAYATRVKRYLRLCFGIKLDPEDFRDFVSLPQKIEEELEPLKKEELRLIIENASTPRRHALYWFIASTGARIAEALQIRVRDIGFEKTPTLVTFPAKITKGKKRLDINF